MASKLDFPLRGPSVNIVRQCGYALSAVIESKFGCVATIDGVDFERDPSFAQQRRPKVVPEQRYAVTLPAGVKVSVWKGDLTSFPVDAVVNAANEHLQHYGGLAQALSGAGGPQIQRESDDYINKRGALKTGDAVVMNAGFLPCKKIIHAVGPELPRNPSQHDVSWAEPRLEKAIRSILDRVKENHLQSVAIPAISSGLFHYPLPQCADTIVKTLQHYYVGPLPKEILLVNNDEPTVKEMERACRQILSSHLPMQYSQAAASKSRGDAKTSTASVQIRNVHLTLKKGKIEEQQTDVIINSIYDKDLRNGQISNAVLQKAGYGIQKEINNASWSGNVIVTKPYKLQCKQVYHTSCTGRSSDTAQQIIYKSVSECLWLAFTASQHKSIAFPAIGTGGLKFDKKEVAQIMTRAVVDFAQNSTTKKEVNFVIFPFDGDTFKAFEEQMRYLQQAESHPSSPSLAAHEERDEYQGSRAPTPQISLSGRSAEALNEAERWLQGLFKSSGTVVIRNNFIQHFGENEHLQLSGLSKKGVFIEEFLSKGRASIIVNRGSNEDVAVAGFQVEAMLCNVQKEFVREEELAMIQMLTNHVSFERKAVDPSTSEFRDRLSNFPKTGLQVLKVDKVENAALNFLFDFKMVQLNCSSPQKMFQRIPAQFCEMVCHIGFHAEYAPPEDPAYGEGIYFAGTVRKAMEVWKEPSEEYLYFVEADVLTGNSTPGKPGLILPPAVETNPQVMYNSVHGGPDISVVFSTYQALPKYIITCKMG
ncbi:protein mono-ADP-ribosyltransferase PARP9 isoform X2 [Micropterus dolomieu]|uniref:protein mono-ADP-ribosyltransferase PARP9 isoform X2 n=1 Tax=Micropterus dolomieu TaxID=147949 RepID=UPI001E8D3658|nr:protein mono-ADP-ribosyltransferase PARP9 isoform X2 [Micropterus dolomieu]